MKCICFKDLEALFERKYVPDRARELFRHMLGKQRLSFSYQEANQICGELMIEKKYRTSTLNKLWKLGFLIKIRPQQYDITPFLDKISETLPVVDIQKFRPLDAQEREALRKNYCGLPEYFQKWQPFCDFVAILRIYDMWFSFSLSEHELEDVCDHIIAKRYPMFFRAELRTLWEKHNLPTPLKYKNQQHPISEKIANDTDATQKDWDEQWSL